MSTDEQIAKLKTDLERMHKAAQDHRDAWQQHLGAAGYIQGRIAELQAEAQKAPEPQEPAK